MQLIDEAVQQGARRAQACEQLGVSVRSVQRWRDCPEDGRTQAIRDAPPNKLDEIERQAVLDAANRPGYASLTPHQIVPKLADEGVYLASESTFYRILKAAGQGQRRGRVQAPLVHHEQGFGDTLQFVRFVDRLGAKGAHVVLRVQDALLPLLRHYPGAAEVIGETAAPPRFDYHVPTLSLPFMLKLREADLATTGPYLHADAALGAGWDDLFAATPVGGSQAPRARWHGLRRLTRLPRLPQPLLLATSKARAGSQSHPKHRRRTTKRDVR
ncbi:helix-turn-helix domain-containing protein [Paraburkholderia bryophila]|uniref:helix-turn-helix domain-containing protein n=1 Tax=Paraburkholderia bryophila TaxID=420952 RepID=UPI00300DCBEA